MIIKQNKKNNNEQDDKARQQLETYKAARSCNLRAT